jgi:hypothetical protein
MAIVIGAATEVYFMDSCVVSAQWGFNPNTQRLYCLGEWTPREDLRYDRPTQTVSLTIYSGRSGTYSTLPSIVCEFANRANVSISPAACGGTFASIDGEFYVDNYSYSKDDAVLPAQETWGMMMYTDDGENAVLPSHVLRGIAEGTSSNPSLTGITFTGATVMSVTGNVQAGGFGKADNIEQGVVISVGAGQNISGEIGQGSVSIPYTPLYIT